MILPPPRLTRTDTLFLYTTIFRSKLRSTPATFINTGFTGRLAGLYTHQSSGQPGSDGVSLSLRGLSPLIIVDNIPRTLPPWSINPEQIESVTILKDALSTALLGIRGMRGAILITTRKGELHPGFNLDMTAKAVRDRGRPCGPPP